MSSLSLARSASGFSSPLEQCPQHTLHAATSNTYHARLHATAFHCLTLPIFFYWQLKQIPFRRFWGAICCQIKSLVLVWYNFEVPILFQQGQKLMCSDSSKPQPAGEPEESVALLHLLLVVTCLGRFSPLLFATGTSESMPFEGK